MGGAEACCSEPTEAQGADRPDEGLALATAEPAQRAEGREDEDQQPGAKGGEGAAAEGDGISVHASAEQREDDPARHDRDSAREEEIRQEGAGDSAEGSGRADRDDAGRAGAPPDEPHPGCGDAHGCEAGNELGRPPPIRCGVAEVQKDDQGEPRGCRNRGAAPVSPQESADDGDRAGGPPACRRMQRDSERPGHHQGDRMQLDRECEAEQGSRGQIDASRSPAVAHDGDPDNCQAQRREGDVGLQTDRVDQQVRRGEEEHPGEEPQQRAACQDEQHRKCDQHRQQGDADREGAEEGACRVEVTEEGIRSLASTLAVRVDRPVDRQCRGDQFLDRRARVVEVARFATSEERYPGADVGDVRVGIGPPGVTDRL